MTDRRDQEGATEQFHELFGADAFLDDLSRGVDASQGKDPLAELFLELHREVNAPMPPVPNVDDLLPAEAAPVADDLAGRRAKKRRGVSPWMSGLVGAAAATLLIAGGGGAIYNAGPDSPLWNAKISLFGEHAAVVDLASALQEVDQRHSSGDVDGAMQLLDRARALADAVNARDRESTQRAIAELEARTVASPATVTESAAPQTSVSTATVTTSAEASTATTSIPAEPVTTTVTETKVSTTRVTVTMVPEPSPTPTASSTMDTSTVTPSPTPVADGSSEPTQANP